MKNVFLALVTIGTSACDQRGATYANICAVPPTALSMPIGDVPPMTGLNRITLNADRSLRWNGAIIGIANLREYLIQSGQLNPEPFIGLEVAPTTDCATVERIRAVMSQASICSRDHRCGEGSGFIAREANIE